MLAPLSGPATVLFVGNSYTMYHSVPEQLAALTRASEAPVDTYMVASGGATLTQHWESGDARNVILQLRPTVVVLQEKSTGPLHDAQDYHRAVDALGDAARAADARICLFETWARHPRSPIYRARWSGGTPAEMLTRIRAELARAAARLGAEIVPVGRAWMDALTRDPELELHDEDLHHASPRGGHLTAAVFYSWLTGRDATGLPYLPPKLNRAEADTLRAMAWRVTEAAR